VKNVGIRIKVRHVVIVLV